jgi:hypothetical protein
VRSADWLILHQIFIKFNCVSYTMASFSNGLNSFSNILNIFSNIVFSGMLVFRIVLGQIYVPVFDGLEFVWRRQRRYPAQSEGRGGHGPVEGGRAAQGNGRRGCKYKKISWRGPISALTHVVLVKWEKSHYHTAVHTYIVIVAFVGKATFRSKDNFLDPIKSPKTSVLVSKYVVPQL